MSKFKTALRFVTNPREFEKALALKIARSSLFHQISDEKYLKLVYQLFMGKKLSLDAPVTFNEKLQWLKLHNRKTEYIQIVDKYRVRDYIKERLGKEFLIPLLGIWDKAEDIDFALLPNQFVLKCNHDSGSVIICKDKMKLDFDETRKKLNTHLKKGMFYFGREWPYKEVKPCIIAEKYMVDSSIEEGSGLTDYKFFCFDGKVDCVMLCLERHLHDAKFYFFNDKWELKRLNPRGKSAPADFTVQKPRTMDRMFEIAHMLSKGFPFIRIDLYECDEQIYFGEMTFFPASGFDANLLPETDDYFGSLIDLRGVKE